MKTVLTATLEIAYEDRPAVSAGTRSDVVPPGSSLVEIDLIEQPDGTLLRLTHTGLPNAEQCAGHAEGWAHYLGRLARGCNRARPGSDPLAPPHWHGVTAFRS